MTRLAYLIAKEEGFFSSGILTQPRRKHNPGDLRHSPHSSHSGEGPEDIGIIDNDADGWADLERQLRIYAGRGYVLGEAIYHWAPPNENNSARYLADVLVGFGGAVDATTPLSRVLEIPA